MICDKINKGLPFDEAVSIYSKDRKREHGKIGTFEEDNLFAFLLDSLSKVQTGGITNPIRFSYGYEIMKVLDRSRWLRTLLRKTRSSINIINRVFLTIIKIL